MRRLAVLAAIFVSIALPCALRADLAADVGRVLATSGLAKAKVGVQVVRLGQLREQDTTVVAVGGDEKLIPASNLKIITTAAAVEMLGPDFRFRTRLAVNASNDLALIGDGDPTLGDSEYLAKTGWSVTTVFENWAAELKRAGIAQVGNVLVDDSIFDEVMFQPHWPLDQAHLEYVAQVAGLNFNANCLDVYVLRKPSGSAAYRSDPPTKYVDVQNQVTVGSNHSLFLSRVLGGNKVILKGVVNATNRTPFRVTIDDPPMYAGTTLAEVLERQGVRVTGTVLRDRTVRSLLDAAVPAGGRPAWRLIAAHETPLLPVMERTNKESINLYAEAIGKRTAAKMFEGPGSWKTLAQAQQAFMKTVGAPADENVFDDGSGLSKENKVTPAAFCATLEHMFHGTHREKYVATLAVGGVDGTLDNRYKTNGLAGRVYAKSGSVRGVSALSGYLKTKSGEWYAFSILMNDIHDRGVAQKTQDEIVRLVDAASP